MFAISAGEYFLGATGSSSLSTSAMLLDNKDFYLALDQNGAIRRLFFVSGEEVVLGSILMTSAQRDEASESCFAVRGTVKGSEGQVVSGMVVMAKNSFNDLRPRFVSNLTDNSGAYQINLAPGEYTLIVRRQEGSLGRPAPGEPFGIYGEIKQVGVGGFFQNHKDQKRVVKGQAGQDIANRDITLFMIPDPEKIKLERQAQ